ncbi:MAG: RNA polymerase sigma factor [Muribaculaceae bacterium]
MQSLELLTDDVLVTLYAEGDNEAFDELLSRHGARLHNYINQLTGDSDLTEDLFQETFVKAIVTIRQGRYTESGKFAAWLSRIARNLIIDHFRSERAEPTVSTDDDNYDILNRRELSEGAIEDNIVIEQILSDVRHLVTMLPDSQREVLELRYYKNLSFKEIAELTGVSINTALGRMRYAIINMRRMAKEQNIVLTR